MDASTSANPLVRTAMQDYLIALLTETMAPCVLQVVDQMHTDAVLEGTGTFWTSQETIIEIFRDKLRTVHDWNASIIKDKTNCIQAKFPALSDLIAAVFVGSTLILSSIKVGSHKPQVRLKLPSNESFVHNVFIESCRLFYDTPEFALPTARQELRTSIVQAAIERSVRTMLPMENLLKAYIGGVDDQQQQQQSLGGQQVLDDDACSSRCSSSSSSSDSEEGETAYQQDEPKFVSMGAKMVHANPPPPAAPLTPGAAGPPPAYVHPTVHAQPSTATTTTAVAAPAPMFGTEEDDDDEDRDKEFS